MKFRPTFVLTFSCIIAFTFSVRAQDVRRASIQIEEVQMNGTSAKVLRGSAVLGLSCAADGSGNVHCYVASGN